MIAWLLACSPEPEPGDAPIRRLTRASLDLRGVRPSLAEIARVEDHPEDLDGLVDEFLRDPRFEDRVREAFQLVLRTRSERFLLFDALRLDHPRDFTDAVGEEPLRLAAHVAADDLPYSELVTADYTVVDEHLAELWPTDYPASATGWRVARYTDDRPAAGLLSTNGLWWRYPSTRSNANRKRANQVSRVFVCEDFLQNQIPFDPDVDLLDEAAIANAIATNPSCTACHTDLDPIASHLYGFWYWYDDGYHSADAAVYHPELEREWTERTGVAPGWFGAPTIGLPGLPTQLVADPRFVPCAVTHPFRRLVGRDPTDDELARHVDAFGAGGFTVRAAWRSIVDDPAYDAVPAKLATPDLLASELEELTGFRWTRNGRDMLGSDEVGVLTLAGGADGTIVTEPLTTPSTTAMLVQDRVGTAAAAYGVAQDLAVPRAERRLLDLVDGDEIEGDPAVARQLQRLHLRLFGRHVAVDGPEVRGDLELFAEVRALDGRVDAAWTAVVAGLLRSPDLVTY